MKRPKEFHIGMNRKSDDEDIDNIMRLCANFKFEGSVLFREVVPMPSDDEIENLSYEYDVPSHRNCMGFCQYASEYEQAWQAGFKKALELMGYKKGLSDV